MARTSKQFDYFESFVKASEAAYEAAKILNATLRENLVNIDKRAAEVHVVENNADKLYHEVMNALNKAFITPLEREDIRMLASSIDDVVDAIDDIVIDFYIYNITDVHAEALEFSEIIVSCCETLRDTLAEFKDYKKSGKIKGLMIKINDYEERGDATYQKAVRKLFTGDFEALDVIKWRKIFEVMELCCDVCENVTDVIEAVILKNS